MFKIFKIVFFWHDRELIVPFQEGIIHSLETLTINRMKIISYCFPRSSKTNLFLFQEFIRQRETFYSQIPLRQKAKLFRWDRRFESCCWIETCIFSFEKYWVQMLMLVKVAWTVRICLFLDILTKKLIFFEFFALRH